MLATEATKLFDIKEGQEVKTFIIPFYMNDTLHALVLGNLCKYNDIKKVGKLQSQS